MCGIWATLGCNPSDAVCEACLRGMQARGPDGAGVALRVASATLGFTRLAINGLTAAGMQPMSSDDASVHIVCNGEVYNCLSLAEEFGLTIPDGSSDCGVLIPLWLSLSGDAEAFARAIDGVFAFVLVDTKRDLVVVGRDPYGVRPLFEARLQSRDVAGVPTGATAAVRDLQARTEVFAGVQPALIMRTVIESQAATVDGRAHLWASEVRGLLPALSAAAGPYSLLPFPPGTVREFSLSTGALLRETVYHAVPWVKSVAFGFGALGIQAREEGAAAARAATRRALISAVEKRLLSDVPIGALLSGGLDSSLVASIAARLLRARGGAPLRTFSIGMPGSSDVAHARAVAEHIGSEHHEITVSVEDFWAALPATITAIESFDTTTVRASVGNYLLGRYVREKTNVRVLLNGDGADEASGSYLYFYGAPNPAAFEAEATRLLRDMHMFDVLRSDRCVAAWGLEARTPFLDKQFVATYLSIPTALRQPKRGGAVEKQLLREAFNDVDAPYLPTAVLWRRKEAFSDGVSGEVSWFEVIASRCEELLPGEAWRTAAAAYGESPSAPFTREGLFYRQLFEAAFGTTAAMVIPYFWLPKWTASRDPSARTLAIYNTVE